MSSPLLPICALEIDCLPDEILVEIFNLHVESGAHDWYPKWYPYARLSHVCSRWRAVLLHMPEFWAAIIHYMFANRLHYDQWKLGSIKLVWMYLSRTGCRPLTVAFGRTLPQPVWAVLTPRFGQISRLNLHLPTSQLLEVHQAIGSSMRSLEWLFLRSLDFHGSAEVKAFIPWKDNNLPKLRTLILEPAALFSSCVVKSLIKVKMGGNVKFHAFASFVEAFRHCPLLEELTIRCYNLVGTGTPTAPTPIVLPCLRGLYIEEGTRSSHSTVFLLDQFAISHPICFILDLKGLDTDNPASQWRKFLPGLYPVERIDTINLCVRGNHSGGPEQGSVQLEGRCEGTLCFRERRIGDLEDRVRNVKNFLVGLPDSVHTLNYDVVDSAWIHGTSEPLTPAAHGRIATLIIDALPGLRTLKVAPEIRRHPRRQLLDAFFGRAARSTAGENMTHGSRFELIWVSDAAPAPPVWDGNDHGDRGGRSSYERELKDLLAVVRAHRPRKTWSLTLGLQGLPETMLFRTIWRSWLQNPSGPEWEDAAMTAKTLEAVGPGADVLMTVATAVIKELAEEVDDLYLVIGDTKFQFGQPATRLLRESYVVPSCEDQWLRESDRTHWSAVEMFRSERRTHVFTL